MGTFRSNILDSEVAQSTNSDSFSLKYIRDFSVQSNVTVTTASAATFTADASTDVCTATAHGMKTGAKVQVSTTTTLPAGLSASTDYFVIYVTVDTFKLATTLNNANAGTAINITSAGTGTHTVTPTSIAGASVKVQGSNDNSNFVDISGTSTNITATGNILTIVTDAGYRWARVVYTMTAGQISMDTIVAGKEDCD